MITYAKMFLKSFHHVTTLVFYLTQSESQKDMTMYNNPPSQSVVVPAPLCPPLPGPSTDQPSAQQASSEEGQLSATPVGGKPMVFSRVIG